MTVRTPKLKFATAKRQKTQVKSQAETQGAPQETPQNTQAGSKTAAEISANSPERSQQPTVRARLRDWKPKFLKEFAKCGIITMAARAVGVDRSAVLYHRTRSPKFAAQFEKALAEANDVLEAHALQLATVGQSDPIFMRDAGNNPVMVFDRKRKSERLMELMLKSRLPQRFREQVSQEISGPGGVALAAPVINATFVIPRNGREHPDFQLKPAEVVQEQIPQLKEPQP